MDEVCLGQARVDKGLKSSNGKRRPFVGSNIHSFITTRDRGTEFEWTVCDALE